MKGKQINIRVTEEEYKIFQQAKLELTIKENKFFSMSGVLIHLVNDYINGNEPKTPSKESVENVDGEQKTFDGVNMDF